MGSILPGITNSSLVASKHFTKWTLIGFLLFYFYFVVILMYMEPTPSNETFCHPNMLFRLTTTGLASVALRTVEEGSKGLFPHDLTTAVSNAHVPKPRPPTALCHPHCELGTPDSWCQLLPLPACLRWASALLWPVAQEPFWPTSPSCAD